MTCETVGDKDRLSREVVENPSKLFEERKDFKSGVIKPSRN